MVPAQEKGSQVPMSSQQSSSDLSDPPESADENEHTRSIVVQPTEPASSNGQQVLANNNNNNTEEMIPALETMVIDKPPHKRSKRNLARRTTPTTSTTTAAAAVAAAAAYDGNDELPEQEDKAALSTTNKRRVAPKRCKVDRTPQEDSLGPPAAKKAKVTKRKSTKWDPDYVTQNTKSPLVDVDLRSLLLQPAAWDCLTGEDKKEILALFPDETHILHAGTPDARPNFESLRNDNSFRHDAEEYTSNLAKGMHDPTWLKDAWTAHHRRAAGDFDTFYIRKVEIEWGASIPDEYKPEPLRSKKTGGGGDDSPSKSSDGQPAEDKLVDAGGEATTVHAGSESSKKTKKDGMANETLESICETKAEMSNPKTSSSIYCSTADDSTSAQANKASSPTAKGSQSSEIVKDEIIVNAHLLPNGTALGDFDDTANGLTVDSNSENPEPVKTGTQTTL